MTWKLSISVVVTCLGLGCAAGSPVGQITDSSAPVDGGISDGLPFDYVYMWPDLGPLPDSFIHPDAPVDAGPLPPDSNPPPPDMGVDQLSPDSHVPCPDPYETNNSCAVSKSLGTAKEGSAWYSKTATLDPATDVDWYKVDAEEGSHTCFPFTKQTYYFKARLDVPPGRHMRLCVYKESCSASATCSANTSAPGPTQLDVQFKVSGTCALNDDTDARIKIENINNSVGCTPYTLSFNYND